MLAPVIYQALEFALPARRSDPILAVKFRARVQIDKYRDLHLTTSRLVVSECKMHITLTDRETQFMDILWEHGPCTVTEVRERLSDNPAYTTVLSILRTLQAKGYVQPTKDGHAHRYAPLITADAARRSALSSLAERLFKGSTELLVTHLVSDKKLTPTQLKRIRDLLDKQRK